MNNIKEKNGAISIFALLSVTFFVLFMLGAYKIVSSKNSQQLSSIQLMQQQYYVSDSELQNWFATISTKDPADFSNQYTVVNYLHTKDNNNTGTNAKQYIDTKLSASRGFKVEMKIQPDKKGDQFLIGAQDSGAARSYVKLITQNNEIVIVLGVYGEWKPVKDSDGNPIILEVGKIYTIKACNVYNKFPDPNLTSSDPDYPWRFYNYFSVEVWDENNENKLAEGYYRWTSASDRNQHKVERSASSLYLFWENHPTPSSVINYRFYGKMYYCDIYVVKSEGIDEEGKSFIEYEKARHFIPVVVSGDSSVDANPDDVITVSDINGNPQSSGKPGMYNDIELEGESAIGFYVNSNTDATFDFYYE